MAVQNIHVTAYSPLGTPPSSAMFKDYQPDLVMNDPIVKDMAKKYNKNVGQVCCLAKVVQMCSGCPHGPSVWLARILIGRLNSQS